jgi:agmatinase
MTNTRIERFIASLPSIEGAEIVVAGFPYDCTASYRAGARFAPKEIRSCSGVAIESFSFYFARDLDEVKFFDAGDMDIMVGDPGVMVEQVQETASSLLKDVPRLIAIGGEHLITYPLFLATKKKHSQFSILHLDAHADLAEKLFGNTLSHGTVFYLCLQTGLDKLVQYGVRSGSKEEFYLRKEDPRIIPAVTIEEIDAALTEGEKIYLSLDFDFFDPGYFPGTGTPEAGGASFDDYIRILKLLKRKQIEIIGADIVELAPEIDHSDASTAFAAKALRETLICMGT